MLKEKYIIYLLVLLFLVFGMTKNILAAERIFYEDCEDTSFTDYFLERSYGTNYSSYWQELTTELTRSDFSPRSGNYSMTYDPFTTANPHAVVGVGDVPYGNTSNFNLHDYAGRYWYFRWYQRWEEDIDWGGYHVKMLYINYQNTPDFTYTIIKNDDTSVLSTLKDYDTYELQNNVYGQTPTVFDMQWHKMELILDVGVTGQDNGSILFKVDNVVSINQTGLHFNNTISSNPIRHITGWPSNLSGSGGSGTARTWLDDLEIYTLDNINDIPPEIGATCSDNIQNQDETGIDCGGVCPACGIPSINEINGGLTRGGDLNITGSSFGQKTPAAPLRYANFEDGVNGEEVPNNEGDGGLYVDGMHQIVYDDTYQRYPGAQNLQQNFNNGVYGQIVGLNQLATINSSRLYVHGYWRIVTHGHVPRNSKFLHMGHLFQHDENDQPTFQSRIDADNNLCNDTPTMMFSMHPECPRIEGNVNWSGDWNTIAGDNGNWHRLDSYMDTNIASRWVNVDNRLWASNSTTNMLVGCSEPSIGYVYFGHYWDNATCSPTPEAQRWWDEIYIDTTQARVEVCNTQTWNNRSHCEIQIPTSWNNNSIDLTFNQGSFDSGETAYLYVIDENGDVNENGYPIIIGGSPITNKADVNQDNKVTTIDALLTLRKTLGLDMANTAWIESSDNGDVDCSNDISATDAMLILRYGLGLPMDGTGWCE